MQHKGTLLGIGLSVLLVTAPALASAAPHLVADVVGVVETLYDDDGRILYEFGVEEANPALGFVKHYIHLAESRDEGHKPNHGGGNGGGDDGGGGSNDCTSTAYKTAGWYWDQPYSAYASSYASVFDSSGKTWDAATGAGIFAGVSSGNRGDAGTYDGVNQFDFVDLGSSSTIAVTTTWYYRGSGLAVESDAEYNTYYAWSTNGDPDAMDVENIGTHEIGHTFGLNHPNGGGIDCLTMYAYADYGETQKRTLGDGDILGIQALYGS